MTSALDRLRNLLTCKNQVPEVPQVNPVPLPSLLAPHSEGHAESPRGEVAGPRERTTTTGRSPSSAPNQDRPVKLYLHRVESWPAAAQAEFEERAAIMEYDGGLSRDQAELMAYTRIVMGYGGPVPEITIRRQDDGTWPEWARSYPGPVRWEK